MNTYQEQYVRILKREYTTRATRNPKFSLRAFAKLLGISPSTLSEISSGKYGVSLLMAKKITMRLGLETKDKELFVNLVEAAHGRSKIKKSNARKKLHLSNQTVNWNQLDEDRFHLISDWYHVAIMDLISLKDFRVTVESVSKKLGITSTQAEEALKRLDRLSMLDENGQPIRKSHSTSSKVPSQAIRNYHRQMLTLAQNSIDSQSIEERDLSSVVMAVPKEKMTEVKEEIAQFRRRIAQMLHQSTEPKEDIYSLSIQFFRLSS